MKILINLIGEQPIPNLLPILYLKPDKTIFLFTQTTEKRAKILKDLVDNSEIKEIDPYDFNYTLDKLLDEFNETDEFICNITGGTKIMSQSLFQVALSYKASILYLQSESNKSYMHLYGASDSNKLTHDIVNLPELISTEIYLRSHIPYFDIVKSVPNSSGIKFENSVCETLRRNNFEVLQNIKPRGEGHQLEIDAVFRLRGTNTVAIAEIKIGDKEMRNPKKGIDQLGLAGQREYLGIYTKRFLITSRGITKPIKELATAHRIIVIDEIEQNRYNDDLTDKSKVKLIERLTEKLN